MSALMKPCLTCGEPTPGSRCAEHTPTLTPTAERYAKRPRELGYDRAWDKLSLRARRTQPWCSDCGSTDDLTCDHSPEAWRRKADGKPIRLEDVDVVCRSCNGKRGRARPATPSSTTDQGGHPDPGRPGTASPAQVPLSEGPPDQSPRALRGPHGSTTSRSRGRTSADGVPVLGEGVTSWRAL